MFIRTLFVEHVKKKKKMSYLMLLFWHSGGRYHAACRWFKKLMLKFVTCFAIVGNYVSFFTNGGCSPACEGNVRCLLIDGLL